MNKILALMAEFITGSVLVSAYDIHYRAISMRALTFPSVIFLDSGGYEARVDHDLSEAYGQKYYPRRWTQKLYRQILAAWPSKLPPTVAVSYDSPKRRAPMERQILAAKNLFQKFTNFASEFLVKPEPDSDWINLDAICDIASELRVFTIIGVTERELDSTIIGRMKKIATLRQTLDKAGVLAPIHIFGSLDTLSTALYYIAGAEIFDGLTWLRFGYHQGSTLYRQNYAVVKGDHGIQKTMKDLAHSMWKDNYYYLDSLCSQLRMFARDGNFAHFETNGDVLSKAFNHLSAQLQA